jgi:hypothetical protein
MTANAELQIAKGKLQNEKCRQRAVQQFATGNLQFAVCSFRSSRRGLNLTEVLIAMGILTLGLLGVAAIFPVGGYYMQQAEIRDRGSAIAQAVMNDLNARGILNPSSWFVTVPTRRTPNLGNWNTGFSADGKYCPARKMPGAWPATFTRPFAETLREALMQPTVATDPTLIGRQFGSAFVIDPIGVAAMAERVNNNNQRNVIARPFPASIFALNLATSFYGGPWQAWGNSMDTWPIRRVTFQQADGWQMTPMVADLFFRGGDDLATEFPDRDDRPANQRWDTLDSDGDGIGDAPLARQWTGDYSWIVCVVPTTNAARDGMAHNPESFAYDVSVVVFYKRPLATDLPETTDDMLVAAGNERPVRASIVSTGLTGGELLLTALVDNSESPFTELKEGQWIMLCGPHPNSSPAEPRFALNWYQVLSIDGTDKKLDANGNPTTNSSEPERRLVTVRGPQWPWLPSANGPSYTNDLSNSLCVGICRGAVAVHTKTLRLESARGAWGSAMSVVVPSDVSSPNVAFD